MGHPGIISARKTADRLSAANAAIWAERCLRTESGQAFSFARHKYQIEPLSLDHPRVSVRKATQGGWTLIFMLRMLHGLIHRKFPQGVIYLFPADVKVSEFSQLRWTPLIDANPFHIGRHVRRTNNIHNKRIGSGNLMMRGAQLTTWIGGVEAESAALRSDPADVVVYDEKDLMPANAVSKVRGRLGHSDFKWEWSLSNPTIPGYGIDLDFQAGDQRHWMVRCEGCNGWTCMELEVPHVLRRLADGRVIRACVHCGAALDIDKGQWVPKFPDRSKGHVSYWWSQLTSHFVSAEGLLAAYEHPPEGNVGDVLRLCFGMPYLEAQYGLSANEILLCCTQEPPASRSSRMTAMGVDVGRVLHVVIGRRVGEDAYRIVAALLVDDFDELKKVARAFRVAISSVDNEPELRAARAYQAQAPGRTWLSDYVEAVGPASYDSRTGVVRVNRTEILDDTHFYLSHPGRLLLPTATKLVRQFAEECASMAKVVTKEPGTGKTRAQYLSRGPDHFRHAFANFLLAARHLSPIESVLDEDSHGHGPTATGSHWDLYH